MTFLNPTYLWLSLGIFIPIAIHLWSRRKVVTVKVGSTQLLQESEPKRTSTVRLNELWLLVLRVLTVLLITLLLASPRTTDTSARMSLVYLIEPSLLNNDHVKRLLNETPAEEVKVLMDGFPNAEGYSPGRRENEIPEYWQLAQKMNALPADSIIVITEGFVSGIKGKRPYGANHVNWTVLPSGDTQNQLLEVALARDTLTILTLVSDADGLYVESEEQSKNSIDVKSNKTADSVFINGVLMPLRTPEPIMVLMRYHDSLMQERHYLSAALKAVAKLMNRPLILDENPGQDSVDATYDLSIWLGDPPEQNLSLKQLIFNSSTLANGLIEPTIDKNVYVLTSRLNNENVFSEHLAEQLYIVLNLRKDMEEKILDNDKRVATKDELRPHRTDPPMATDTAGLVDPFTWLWGLLFLMIALERVLAKYRKQ